MKTSFKIVLVILSCSLSFVKAQANVASPFLGTWIGKGKEVHWATGTSTAKKVIFTITQDGSTINISEYWHLTNDETGEVRVKKTYRDCGPVGLEKTKFVCWEYIKADESSAMGDIFAGYSSGIIDSKKLTIDDDTFSVNKDGTAAFTRIFADRQYRYGDATISFKKK